MSTRQEETIEPTDELASLREEVARLKKRVEELAIPARRFNALVDGAVVSVQIYGPNGYTREVSPGWEKLWNLRLKDVERYCVLEDPNVIQGGLMPGIEKAFLRGEASALLPIRYDPVTAGTIDNVTKEKTRWVATAVHPVKSDSGDILELVMLHFDMGEIKSAEEELRSENERLEVAVAERTRDLEAQLQLIREQQASIQAMASPVLRIWDRVLAVPVIGHVDAKRGRLILEGLLQAIVETGSDRVVIDLTGVPVMDVEAFDAIRSSVRAASLLGAQCVMTGISPAMAQTILQLGVGVEEFATFSTLQDGLRHMMSVHAPRKKTRAMKA